MCDEEKSASVSGFGRRALLGGAGLALGGVLGGAGVSTAQAATMKPSPRSRDALSAGMHLVTLGTYGGPPPVAARAGISSAVVVDGATYLVDAGRAAVQRFGESGLRLSMLRGIFLTHLHADHVADYYNFFLLGGNRNPGTSRETLAGPVTVYGPAAAGALPDTFGGGESPTIAPEDPTPGTAAMTDYLHRAFAYSSNLFLRDSGIRDIRDLANVQEIPTPAEATADDRAPEMTEFVVMEDDRVRVTAILVPHGPVLPAYAFRFTSVYGSITISGDTAVSPNLVRLANGSDILQHEAMNIEGFAGPPALISHLKESHVVVQEVGSIAEQCDVRTLVVSHLADLAANTINVARWRRWAQTGFSGRAHIAQDLDVFTVS